MVYYLLRCNLVSHRIHSFAVRLPFIIGALAIATAGTFAQDVEFTLDDLAPLIQEWAKENIDETFLEALSEPDEKRTRAFFVELNRRLQNESVYDLGELKDTASTLLPLLERIEETQPYASWLKTHLDYLIVADDWRRAQPPPKPGSLAPNPSPDTQRDAWQGQLKERPMPARAKPYVTRLKPLFLAQGVPTQLVWLGEVESSFDPRARSPAGAVGMFQFMPATARGLGLSLFPRDDRLDPEKSARAAARYLRYLYGRFGDWRLTLAAYNAGETRVRNLLTRFNTRSYSVIAPRLPSETQMYIPKIEATLRKREGVALTTLTLPKTGS
jgi:membrane-bound lytic murein transglycosylase D